MFVVWTFHYIAPANRFLLLALAALLLLLLGQSERRPGALLLGGSSAPRRPARLLDELLGAHGFRCAICSLPVAPRLRPHPAEKKDAARRTPGHGHRRGADRAHRVGCGSG